MPQKQRSRETAPQDTETLSDEQLAAAKKAGETAVAGERDKSSLDDLLDEIDTVLESNAEEFVADYIQKGGQ